MVKESLESKITNDLSRMEEQRDEKNDIVAEILEEMERKKKFIESIKFICIIISGIAGILSISFITLNLIDRVNKTHNNATHANYTTNQIKSPIIPPNSASDTIQNIDTNRKNNPNPKKN